MRESEHFYLQSEINFCAEKTAERLEFIQLYPSHWLPAQTQIKLSQTKIFFLRAPNSMFLSFMMQTVQEKWERDEAQSI